MAQTPQQRRANAKFQKEQEAKMGKSPEQLLKKKVKEDVKSPVSRYWLVLLGFVVFGGLVIELISRFLL